MDNKLTKKTKFSFGIGAIGKDMVYMIVSAFLLYYYNTVLGISATFIGVVFMAARIFDAFNDPIMGIIVEKTNTKMGKFRPWILTGTILNAFVLYAMFNVPESLHGKGLLIYASLAYVLWGVTYTIMDIPYWSMIPAITDNAKDREDVSVIARMFAGFGSAIPTVLTTIIVPILGKGNERAGYGRFALLIAIIFVIAIIITVLNVKETAKVSNKTNSVKDMVSALVRNDQALIVVVAIIVFNASLYLTQQLALYFFKFDIGHENYYSIFAAVGGAIQLIAMSTFTVLRKKFSRIQIFTGAVASSFFGYMCMFLLSCIGITHIVALLIAAAFIFFGFGLVTVLTTIFLSDTVDYGEYKNGRRDESVVFSLQTFVVKLASAISGLIAGVGIDIIGFDKDATVQSTATLFGLRCIMLIIPLAGILVTMLYFRAKYKLTEQRVGEIKEQLKEQTVEELKEQR